MTEHIVEAQRLVDWLKARAAYDWGLNEAEHALRTCPNLEKEQRVEATACIRKLRVKDPPEGASDWEARARAAESRCHALESALIECSKPEFFGPGGYSYAVLRDELTRVKTIAQDAIALHDLAPEIPHNPGEADDQLKQLTAIATAWTETTELLLVYNTAVATARIEREKGRWVSVDAEYQRMHAARRNFDDLCRVWAEDDGPRRAIRLINAANTAKARLAEMGEAAQKVEDLNRKIDRLKWALRGGNADHDNATLMEFAAARMVNVYEENPNVDFVLALKQRAGMIREALGADSSSTDLAPEGPQATEGTAPPQPAKPGQSAPSIK